VSITRILSAASLAGIILAGTSVAYGDDCSGLPSHKTLTNALKKAQSKNNGGLGLNMWASIVNRDGTVCAVAFSGTTFRDQWLGSRVISAQKANTANDFSLDGLALSTANLFTAVQPGGTLFGLQESNPVDPTVAYAGPADKFGTPDDPMVGKRIGGVNVFGGGLALYSGGHSIGGVGVSGDTSCADHNIAWRVRQNLALDTVPAGVSPGNNDAIVYDIINVPPQSLLISKGGFGHPVCSQNSVNIAVRIGAGFDVRQ
jgi:uncharacterized protein GlcG (DUF336 family)